MKRVICTDFSERSLAAVSEYLKKEKLPVLAFGGHHLKSLARKLGTHVYTFLPLKTETDGTSIAFLYRTDCFELRIRQEIGQIEQFIHLEKTGNIIPSFLWDEAILTFEANIETFGRKLKWVSEN